MLNYKKYYECNTDGRIKWLGNLDKLREFVSTLFGAGGKWRSPGGKGKSFTNEHVELTWYADKKSLLLQGPLGPNVKELMITPEKNHMADTEAEDIFACEVCCPNCGTTNTEDQHSQVNKTLDRSLKECHEIECRDCSKLSLETSEAKLDILCFGRK